MTCRHCRRLLSPYIDHVLTTAEQAQVMEHVAHCSRCGEQLRQLEESRQLLRAWSEVEVTEAMTLRLQRRVWSLRERRNWGPETGGDGTSLNPLVSSLSSLWRNWGIVSVGTLATAAALLFYVSTMHSPTEVSAEEVVSSMTQLLDDLDPDVGTKILKEEAREESAAEWSEDFDAWFLDGDDGQN